MKRRPITLTILALFIFGISISLPIQIMIRFSIPPTDPGAIADKLAPLNWFVMAIGIVLSGLVFRASAMARVLAPVFLALVSWNNWLVISLDPYADSDVVILGTALVYASTAILVFPEIRKLFANPGLRWWLTPPRKKVALPARVRPVHGGTELLAQTFDLSEEGVFITVENWGIAPTRLLSVGSHCSVVLDLAPNQTVNGIARIVRHARASGQYPTGFAVYFEGLEESERKRLKAFVKSLPATTS